MTNSSLKQRVEKQAAALASALQEPSGLIPEQLRALAAQLELTISSLERLPANVRSRGMKLARHLSKEAEIYEDGFEAHAGDELRALQEWLTEVPQ